MSNDTHKEVHGTKIRDKMEKSPHIDQDLQRIARDFHEQTNARYAALSYGMTAHGTGKSVDMMTELANIRAANPGITTNERAINTASRPVATPRGGFRFV